jgi:hypothetical protein
MYLTTKGGTYYRGTEQCSRRAPFLILFTWNDFRALDELRAECAQCVELERARQTAIDRHDGSYADMPTNCPAHDGIRSGVSPEVYRYSNGKPKIWATVRSVALHQCGHFMMGAAMIHGARVSISGAYGADGLPRDYQDVPKIARDRLVLVPEDIASVFWAGNGHNSAGNEAPTIHAWAVRTFAQAI